MFENRCDLGGLRGSLILLWRQMTLMCCRYALSRKKNTLHFFIFLFRKFLSLVQNFGVVWTLPQEFLPAHYATPRVPSSGSTGYQAVRVC